MAEPNAPVARQGEHFDPVRNPRGSDRLGAAMLDLSLDPAVRPSEQERALMLTLLTGMIAQIAEELSIRVPDQAIATPEPEAVVDELRSAGLLARPDLVALLVRRADVLALGADARTNDGGGAIQRWGADPDGAISSAAMAVVLARTASRDRFGRPGLTLADCDAELAVALTYAVAATLPGSAETLIAAAIDLLARHDEGERLEAQEARLMRALDQGGRLDDALLLSLSAQGEVGLLAEGLARLAQIPSAEAWAMLSGQGAQAVGRLLRMAELERNVAAGIIAALSEGRSLRDAALAMRCFDEMTADEAKQERARLRLPRDFLRARTALGHDG